MLVRNHKVTLHRYKSFAENNDKLCMASMMRKKRDGRENRNLCIHSFRFAHHIRNLNEARITQNMTSRAFDVCHPQTSNLERRAGFGLQISRNVDKIFHSLNGHSWERKPYLFPPRTILLFFSRRNLLSHRVLRFSNNCAKRSRIRTRTRKSRREIDQRRNRKLF